MGPLRSQKKEAPKETPRETWMTKQRETDNRWRAALSTAGLMAEICCCNSAASSPTNSTVSSSTSDYSVVFDSLTELAILLDVNSDVLRTARAVRITYGLRKKLTEELIYDFLCFAVSKNSELHDRLYSFLFHEVDEQADSATSTLKLAMKVSPELEFYCYYLVLIFLIDQKRYNEAKYCVSDGVGRLMNLNRGTIDTVTFIAARLYFYYSYCYEVSSDLSEIRRNLCNLYNIAAFCHDELSQETLLNLLLRNYLHYNLYDQAEKWRSKAPKFQTRSYHQVSRYLFYLGKIQTIRLEYIDAKESFLLANWKAPAAARGFRIQCIKWAVLVRLLLGEVPERTIFTQRGFQGALRPYFELTKAVRIGDLELFSHVAEKYASIFISDWTNNVIVRLRHSVIRIGLRNISISYSRISLADVADKLKMHSENLVADVENIVAKTIRDGGINTKIDHANGWLVSKETGDVYSTAEPRTAFSSRIAFYLNLHNEAAVALRFPLDKYTDEWKRASQILMEHSLPY